MSTTTATYNSTRHGPSSGARTTGGRRNGKSLSVPTASSRAPTSSAASLTRSTATRSRSLKSATARPSKARTSQSHTKSSQPTLSSLASSFNNIQRHLGQDTFDNSWGKGRKADQSNYTSLLKDTATAVESYESLCGSDRFPSEASESYTFAPNDPKAAIHNLREEWSALGLTLRFNSQSPFDNYISSVYELRNALSSAKASHRKESRQAKRGAKMLRAGRSASGGSNSSTRGIDGSAETKQTSKSTMKGSSPDSQRRSVTSDKSASSTTA